MQKKKQHQVDMTLLNKNFEAQFFLKRIHLEFEMKMKVKKWRRKEIFL